MSASALLLVPLKASFMSTWLQRGFNVVSTWLQRGFNEAVIAVSSDQNTVQCPIDSCHLL